MSQVWDETDHANTSSESNVKLPFFFIMQLLLVVYAAHNTHTPDDVQLFMKANLKSSTEMSSVAPSP